MKRISILMLCFGLISSTAIAFQKNDSRRPSRNGGCGADEINLCADIGTVKRGTNCACVRANLPPGTLVFHPFQCASGDTYYSDEQGGNICKQAECAFAIRLNHWLLEKLKTKTRRHPARFSFYEVTLCSLRFEKLSRAIQVVLLAVQAQIAANA